jgi:hypothetical protein
VAITSGKILELDPQPFDISARPDPGKPGAGPFEVGQQPAGIARAWIEAAPASELLIQMGSQSARVPLASLVESGGWVRTPVNARVRRIPWDAIAVRWLEGEGIYAPGAKVPISITVQPLVDARITQIQATLRPHGSGEAIWTSPRLAHAPEQAKPLSWNIPAPGVEGTYVLDVSVLAETVPAEANENSLTRLSRIWKRKKPATTLTLRRRVSFVVLDPSRTRSEEANAPNPSAEAQLDLVDFARIKPPRWHAAGRSPVSDPDAWNIPTQALTEPNETGPKDRILGLISRGADVSMLPVASTSGWAWSALRLQNARPGKPHKLVLTVTGGSGDRLGIALVSASPSPRLLFDTTAAIDPSSLKPQTFTWILWPDTVENTLVVVNQSSQGAIRLGSIELREIPQPAAATLPEPAPESSGRHLALTVADARALSRFGGSAEPENGPVDRFRQIQNLAAYLKQCGASTAVLGSQLADRAERQGLNGQSHEDPLAPDVLQLALQMLAREGLEVLIAIPCEDTLPGLPPPGSPQARARGLVRYGPDGQCLPSGYPLLHPEVRAALQRRLEQVAALHAQHPNLRGIVMHLGHESCLPGGTGVIPDHHTYQQFLQASFSSSEIARLPGQSGSEADRLKQRARFLSGEGSKPWLDWRCAEVGRLYHDLAVAVARAAPGACLVLTTPTFDREPGTSEALRADRNGLSPVDAWRSLGFDPEVWPRDAQGPVLIRSVNQNGSQRLRDLASSPELDFAILNQTQRGLWIGGIEHSRDSTHELTMHPAGLHSPASAAESLAHAVAALDANWIFISPHSLAGLEDQIARFARVFRALPTATRAVGASIRPDSGVAVRTISGNGHTFISYANDTPYRVLVESTLHADPAARIEDLGRTRRLLPADAPTGGKSLVIELAPFAVAAVRISQPDAQVVHRPPYIPALAELDAQAEDISARLASLSATSSDLNPLPNGTFEFRPDQAPGTGAKEPPMNRAPLGWNLADPAQGSIALDTATPRSGQACLKLTPRSRPAAVQSEMFLPPPTSQLMLSTWMKAEKPHTRVRITLEGESRGKPMNRQAEVMLDTDWKPLKLQTTDFPAEGLDRARVRFEVLEGDSIWIDDVDLVSLDRTAPPGRRAHRVLTAALQAYREKRYADFARLTGSPWARAVLEPGRSPFEPALRTGSASGTDLPPARRIR